MILESGMGLQFELISDHGIVQCEVKSRGMV